MGLPQWLGGKDPAYNADVDLIPGSGRSPGVGNGNPLWYFFAWEIPWTEEPVGYSPKSHKELDMTEVT